MLFRYPVVPAKVNWLHSCLADVMQRIHAILCEGQPFPEWPDIIPEAYRPALRSRRGLKERIQDYYKAISTLSQHEWDRIYEAFQNQNRISQLLTCDCDCEDLDSLPEATREQIGNLFGFGFQLLAELGTRDKAYSDIYSAISDHLCPFCGLEYFDAPGGPREAFDHYLPEAQYPFAAANLRNLVPMGHKCNSKYKLAKDILRQEDGTRRRSFDPYGAAAALHICMSRSRPFEGKDGRIPAWQIDFDPASEETTTWDNVFRIRERYERDILDKEFNTWLRNFSSWCKSVQIQTTGATAVLEALERYADYQLSCGLADRSFLKAAMFRMLWQHCRNGNERLIEFLNDLI